jgi:hypothetical protein
LFFAGCFVAAFFAGVTVLRRIRRLGVCLVVGLGWGSVGGVGMAPSAAEEATREACDAGIAAARGLAAALPNEDVSRYFAERHLQQAVVEGGNGEFDDCLEQVAQATDEVRERRHSLAPGERLKILQADEVPPR